MRAVEASTGAGEMATQGPVAAVKQGKLMGYEEKGILVFKGIPYGADTATTRFRGPQPALDWTGVRDARKFDTIAPQPGGGKRNNGTRSPEGDYTESEDCLRLNVWTPALRDGRKRPILVYFHGGAYNGGSVNSDLYDGVNLSRKGDVVVVTVNHRLNGFGFLFLKDLGEVGGSNYLGSGNAGMLDLVLALQWVRDNAAEFGGDAGCVTIFGQSGGGAKCATLMAMPEARGLFHRVWTMSGQQVRGRDRARANMTALNVLKKLGLPPASIKELDTMSTASLRQAMNGEAWTPVMDGVTLPVHPFWPEAAPQSGDIPMVLGNTLDETANLIGAGDPEISTMGWDKVPAKVTQHVKTFIGELKPEDIVRQYREWYPERSPAQVFIAISTAARSWKGMVLECEARARQNQAPTYAYHLVWRSPTAEARHSAEHTLDIPLVFDNVDKALKQTGGGAEARRCAEQMSSALLAFARTGNPNTPGLAEWPRLTVEGYETMLFGPEPRAEKDPRGQERKLFAPIPYNQPGT